MQSERAVLRDAGLLRVQKFSEAGQFLIKWGNPSTTPSLADGQFSGPLGIAVDPRNGDVYVAESHTDVASQNLIGRISVFNKSGKLVRTIGKAGIDMLVRMAAGCSHWP